MIINKLIDLYNHQQNSVLEYFYPPKSLLMLICRPSPCSPTVADNH